VLAIARTFALAGIEAERVHVELDIRSGLPAFTIVGLPDTAVRESRERVRAALVNAGFTFPMQRITASLAPADLPKAGPGFDLAIAAAILVASGQLPRGALERYTLAGELALDGSIRPVPGVLAMAEGTADWGLRGIAVSPADTPGASLVEGVDVIALDHVAQLRRLAAGELEPVSAEPWGGAGRNGDSPDLPDLAELRGQPALRDALEVVAAGSHSILLVGPPGAGKTLAAQRLPSLLPPLEHAEALEVIRIAGACGEPAAGREFPRRPFRAPHHSSSARALIGGGRPPRPGEVTRAHRGVLFLDELGEFRRDALEALRQPLEEGRISLSRAGRSVTLPSRFLLVAASNPCPCGRGPDSGECECHPTAVSRYRAKLSGALADRIDVFLSIDRPPADGMAGEAGEGSAKVRERVIAARERQAARLGPGRANAEMTAAELRRHCVLDEDGERTLRRGHEKHKLSGRGWDRVLRLARTLADLDEKERITEEHVASALTARRPVER
jgi:magnesium chelatase family protein